MADFTQQAGTRARLKSNARRQTYWLAPAGELGRATHLPNRPELWRAPAGGTPSGRRGLFPSVKTRYPAEGAGIALSALRSVITSGQARHAASPDCRCHRQCRRMEHSGSAKGSSRPAVRSACSRMMTLAMPHLPSVHWTHAARLQVLVNRNLFSGERPWRASSTKAASITIRSFENATVPSAKTIPIRLAPASHFQLGQRIADSDMLGPAITRWPQQRIGSRVH